MVGWSKWGSTLVLLAGIAGLGGCAPQPDEYVLKPEDVLPSGYEERKVPDGLFTSLGLAFTSQNQGWARGFVWSGDWPATVAHFEATASEHNYTASSQPLIQSTDAVGITNEEYLRDYVSPGGTIEIVLLNLRVLRNNGALLETSADYLVISGNAQELKRSMHHRPGDKPAASQ